MAGQSSPPTAVGQVSLQSRFGLNSVNFFLAEVTGVIMPFLGKFLGDHGWDRQAAGIAAAIAGLGVLVMQTPAGFLVDRIQARRLLLAATSLVLGVCFCLIPLVPEHPVVLNLLLFGGGAAQAFFGPLLGALALALVGARGLSGTMGANQSWNHAGNIAAALSALLLVGWFGTASVFYTVLAISLFAAGSAFLMRGDELDETRASGGDHAEPVSMRELCRDRRIITLFVAVTLFHLANAPVMPLVGRYISELDGSDEQVAAVVLVAQAVMVPVALLAGWLAERWGRKPVFAIGFVALPVRIFLYSLTSDPWVLVALQTLDGIGAGIYGVVIVLMCADLTRGKGRFNALQGLIATALSVGGVVGPFVAGVLAEHLSFAAAFVVFAVIAALAAVVFLMLMPETQIAEPNDTRPDERSQPERRARDSDAAGAAAEPQPRPAY